MQFVLRLLPHTFPSSSALVLQATVRPPLPQQCCQQCLDQKLAGVCMAWMSFLLLERKELLSQRYHSFLPIKVLGRDGHEVAAGAGDIWAVTSVDPICLVEGMAGWSAQLLFFAFFLLFLFYLFLQISLVQGYISSYGHFKHCLCVLVFLIIYLESRRIKGTALFTATQMLHISHSIFILPYNHHLTAHRHEAHVLVRTGLYFIS